MQKDFVNEEIVKFVSKMNKRGLTACVAVSQAEPNGKESFVTELTTAWSMPNDMELLESEDGFNTLGLINQLESRDTFRQSNVMIVIESLISKHINPNSLGKGALDMMVNGIMGGLEHNQLNEDSDISDTIKKLLLLDPEQLKKTIAKRLISDIVKCYESEYD